MNQYQQTIATTRYARWLPEENRRETWRETVDRYVSYWEEKGLIDKEWANKLFAAIYGLETMPSMRCLMTAGPALDRDNMAGFNCSYITMDDPRAFDELMYILMCGTGAGYSVERQYVSKLPEIPHEMYETDTTIVVEDSKIGWSKALRQLIAILYAGEMPKWDTSKVRASGAPLKTFGGRASGPEPLEDLFKFITVVFKGAKGRKLSSLEVHDICCKIAEIVVVGGVRRSALISLSNPSDGRLRTAKSGQWWIDNPQRSLANNSACYTEKPEFDFFLDEMRALYESKSGERGVFSRVAAKAIAAKNGRRDTNVEFGTNPCCVAPETLILTEEGYKPIVETVGKRLKIWNGESWEPVVPYAAGEAELYRVTLSDGSYLDCTANHRWVVEGEFVETEFLEPGMKLSKFSMPVVTGGVDPSIDAYSQGFYSGDGSTGLNRSYIYAPKYPCIKGLVGEVVEDGGRESRKVWKHGPMLDKAYVPTEASLHYKLEWLAGLLDSDGTVTRDKNSSGFQIASIDHDFLNEVRIMLTTLGVRAKVVKGKKAGKYYLPDGKGGEALYQCQELKRLLIGNFDSWHLQNLGLSQHLRRLQPCGGKPQRDARRFVQVVDIIELGRVEMTYCFTEPKTSRGTFNGIVTGNSEIILRPNQVCNLSEVVVRANDTIESLVEKVELATILGTLQSTLVNFRYLRPIWKKNTEEEALLGVSLTGIMDNELMSGKLGEEELKEALKILKWVAIDTNREWSKKLGVNPSAAITCIKPSGTVSQLVDSASGIHPRFSPYYVRTIRQDVKDPVTNLLIDTGVPNEVDHLSPTNIVFSFPQKAPEGAICADELGAMEQLRLWEIYQDEWCEHKPSITVYYTNDEFLDVISWMWKKFDKMSGISLLPYTEHTYKQAPYQECTKEQYEALLTKMPVINWDKLKEYEKEDATKSSHELACVGGACEL